MAIKLAEQTNGPHIFMRLRLDSGRVEEIDAYTTEKGWHYVILLRWLPIPARTMTGGDGGQHGSRMKKCAQLRSLGRRSMPSSRSFSPCRSSKLCG